jgi:hypothetical protein
LEKTAEEAEAKDCTSCPFLEFVLPRKEFFVFVTQWYRCQKKSTIFLNRNELKEAYKGCEVEKEVGVKTPLGSQIVDELVTINTLFQTLTNSKLNLFREDVRITKDIMLPCKDEKEFRSRIGSLALIFEAENLKELRSILKGEEDWKLIKLVENWLKKEGIDYEPDMIQTWENIVLMRDKTHPYHPESSETISLFRYFGQGIPPIYSQLWEAILEKLLESFRKFKGTLTFMIRGKG